MILAISSTTAIVIGAAVLAALIAVVLGIVGYGAARRSREAADARMAALLEDLRSRIDDVNRGVSDALAKPREEPSRVADADPFDLESVLRQTLVAARAIPGADAARVTVAAGAGEPLTRADGLTPRDEPVDPLWPPPAGRLRTLRLDYDAGDDPSGIKEGLAVPMRAVPGTEADPEAGDAPSQPATIGLLSIFARTKRGAFSEAEAYELDELARRTAPRVNDALRVHDLEQRAVIDRETGLYNKDRFYDVLGTEVRRAERHQRPLALLAFDLDDFKDVNTVHGHLAADEVIREIARRLTDCRVRQEDIPCRVGGGDEFAVILPESDLAAAALFYERLRAAIAAEPLPHVGPVSLSAAIAELWTETHESDRTFLARVYAAREQAKRRGKGRVAASLTLAQAVAQAGFAIWVPGDASPDWTAEIIHLPSPADEAVLVTYTRSGAEILSLTETPATQDDPGDGLLRVQRGATTIVLESETATAQWLADAADTLVEVPFEKPSPEERWPLPAVDA